MSKKLRTSNAQKNIFSFIRGRSPSQAWGLDYFPHAFHKVGMGLCDCIDRYMHSNTLFSSLPATAGFNTSTADQLQSPHHVVELKSFPSFSSTRNTYALRHSHAFSHLGYQRPITNVAYLSYIQKNHGRDKTIITKKIKIIKWSIFIFPPPCARLLTIFRILDSLC